MNEITQYANEALDFARHGFTTVNAIQGLIVALVAAFLLGSWKRLWFIALGATVVHIIIDTLLPVIANKAAFRLPNVLEVPFWRYAALLYVGYFIVIAVLFFIKKHLLGGKH